MSLFLIFWTLASFSLKIIFTLYAVYLFFTHRHKIHRHFGKWGIYTSTCVIASRTKTRWLVCECGQKQSLQNRFPLKYITQYNNCLSIRILSDLFLRLRLLFWKQQPEFIFFCRRLAWLVKSLMSVVEERESRWRVRVLSLHILARVVTSLSAN